MNDDNAGFMVSAILIIISLFAGCHQGMRDQEREAVKNGVGEYYINENYSKEFRWVTNKCN